MMICCYFFFLLGILQYTYGFLLPQSLVTDCHLVVISSQMWIEVLCNLRALCIGSQLEQNIGVYLKFHNSHKLGVLWLAVEHYIGHIVYLSLLFAMNFQWQRPHTMFASPVLLLPLKLQLFPVSLHCITSRLVILANQCLCCVEYKRSITLMKQFYAKQ